MIIKCTNCNGALKYDATIGKMKCEYCDATFEPKEVSAEIQEEDTMECNVLTCTSCGSELMINGVETATFCAYCGQPTIVFNRVSKMLKPKKIIPFSVTKQQAVDSIRKRFQRGYFIPKEIKNFEVERVTGIYIPYWLYDVTYYDKQMLRGKSGKHYHNYVREARSFFKNVTVDASSNFCNESSQRLEPFDMNGVVEFEEGYLSGFYADRYDQNSDDLRRLAVRRCGELFDEEVIKSISATNITVTKSDPQSEINNQVYAMLPAWFMTLRYENRPYTMLVNGQTGKVVGAVPIQKNKVWMVFVGVFIMLVIICAPVSAGLFTALWHEDFEDFFEFLCCYGIVGFTAFTYGWKNWQRIKENIALTSSKEMNDYAGNRQEGEK